MTMSTIQSSPRVVLVDDHEMVREALARILQESGKIDVVAQASNGAAAVEAIRDAQPEVVVLDYSMPDENAPEVIAKALQIAPRTKILVLTVHENTHYAVHALEAGAHGYLIKSAAVDELVEAINAVRNGSVYLSPGVSQEVLQHMRRPKRQRSGLESLSQREFEFLRNFAGGKSLQATAKQMNVSTSTASTYRSRILEKLNLSGSADMIRYALEHGVAD